MAAEFFWDTSGFFALLSSDDAAHASARDFLAEAAAARRPSVTTEWVIGECCTLLSARRRSHLIPRLLDYVESSRALTVLHPDAATLAEVRTFLRKHLDQGFSHTDCVSFVVMRERQLDAALTTDEHFAQAGFRALLRP